MPTVPMPPQLAAARAQLEGVLTQVEKQPVALQGKGWGEIEKLVVKVLGGAFDLQRPEHQVVALALSAELGERLANESKGFWFPSRESPEGAALGFQDALVMLSPFGAVVESLGAAKLERLDEIQKEVRTSLGRAKFSMQGAMNQQRLGPADYQRLFDPGFVQLVGVDQAKAEQAMTSTPEKLARDLREAIARASRLPEHLRKQLESQLVGSLQQLAPNVPLVDQAAQAPRLVELIGHLFGGTGPAPALPEELLADVVLPLAFIGTPAGFPKLEGEELEAAKQGVPPLYLMLETVPFAHQAPEDEGLLGAFPYTSVAPIHPKLAQLPSLRVVQVSLEALQKPLEAFDPAKTRDTVKRFAEQVALATGAQVPPTGEAEQVLDAAIAVLKDYQKLAKEKKTVWLRRLTQAEADGDVALAEVRNALGGPRIILA